MTLLAILNNDIKQAMREKDKETLGVLRLMKAAIQNAGIESGRELTEEEELAIVIKEAKQRRDSLKEFEAAGRDDLVEKGHHELSIVERYLPEQLSEDELTEMIEKTMKEANITSMKEFGKLMGILMPKVKGKADGNQVNQIVKSLLS
ncbi:GatB/YqeY domain-containing protein [Vagococcus lutrae]|uniref:GatB/YqeY domain-containing protein n=1 Tax=Vagococcus lutrae TaxID=81947 RepID=UPI0028920D3C|nr:GatB/YqeY domain-containing protein [Vagococcus lutrae]MDT2808092.1 GatB/YqeY domain-containing protein [Vagococcus lutrae]MDY3706069.1 GatB/YqeY domain-containing protein [Vagococcus lutrae]